MKTLFKISMVLYLMGSIAFACDSSAEVGGYTVGCPFDKAGFRHVYANGDLERYQKPLSNHTFDVMEVYVINGNIEGIDFSSSRELQHREIVDIVMTMQQQYGRMEYFGTGIYVAKPKSGPLFSVDFISDGKANQGRPSLLYMSKKLSKRLVENDLATSR